MQKDWLRPLEKGLFLKNVGPMYLKIIFILIILMFFGLEFSVFISPVRASDDGNDPWVELETLFPEKKKAEPGEAYDPWSELRKIYLPFTQQEEDEAVKDYQSGLIFSKKLLIPIRPYLDFIEECSEKFSVPKEVIGAVMLVESGGNPRAAARTSSAKGLMQTIKGTFNTARKSLSKRGVYIDDDPFDPRSSIYAGTWYLEYVFNAFIDESPGLMLSRMDIENWKTPVKYYYAGPGDGARKEDLIIKYIDGRKLVIDKGRYCKKVMRYARLLKPCFEAI